MGFLLGFGIVVEDKLILLSLYYFILMASQVAQKCVQRKPYVIHEGFHVTNKHVH